MRVIVNRLAALGRKTGVGHYTLQLLRRLREQAGADQVAAYPDGWMRGLRQVGSRLRPYLGGKESRLPAGPGGARPSLKGRAVRRLRQWGQALTARHFRLVCGGGGFDLYHEPNFIPLPADVPIVTTLCDLSVLLYPQWHPADRVAHFERHFRPGLARGRHFLAISEHCRQEVIRHLHVPPERVTRTYLGIRSGLGPRPAAEVAAALKQLDLPPRYLLYLGTIEPRKNLLVLLRAYCSLPAGLRDRWPLLLVGGWGWNAGDVAEYLHAEARHRGVRHVGYLSDRHLAAVYNGARALVYPSLYEGFGLPPVEMMACGGAVLASTAGAVAEVVAGRAHLTAPEDADGWRQALARVVSDDDWWQSLRVGVTAVARRYTWENCAAETLRVYRRLCGVPVKGDVPAPRRAAG